MNNWIPLKEWLFNEVSPELLRRAADIAQQRSDLRGERLAGAFRQGAEKREPKPVPKREPFDGKRIKFYKRKEAYGGLDYLEIYTKDIEPVFHNKYEGELIKVNLHGTVVNGYGYTPSSGHHEASYSEISVSIDLREVPLKMVASIYEDVSGWRAKSSPEVFSVYVDRQGAHVLASEINNLASRFDKEEVFMPYKATDFSLA